MEYLLLAIIVIVAFVSRSSRKRGRDSEIYRQALTDKYYSNK